MVFHILNPVCPAGSYWASERGRHGRGFYLSGKLNLKAVWSDTGDMDFVPVGILGVLPLSGSCGNTLTPETLVQTLN
ncbi:hypothetical protein AOLI_G00271050 [Acnodon oligacanthus]